MYVHTHVYVYIYAHTTHSMSILVTSIIATSRWHYSD